MLDKLYPNSATLKDWLVECGPDATDPATFTQLTSRGIREVNHAVYVLLLAFLLVMFVIVVLALAYQGVKFLGFTR